MFLTATIRTDTGESVGVLVLQPKEFKSGAEGWHGQGKIEVDGLRYQTQAQLVKIKGQAEPKPDAEAPE